MLEAAIDTIRGAGSVRKRLCVGDRRGKYLRVNEGIISQRARRENSSSFQESHAGLMETPLSVGCG